VHRDHAEPKQREGWPSSSSRGRLSTALHWSTPEQGIGPWSLVYQSPFVFTNKMMRMGKGLLISKEGWRHLPAF